MARKSLKICHLVGVQRWDLEFLTKPHVFSCVEELVLVPSSGAECVNWYEKWVLDNRNQNVV